RGPSVRASRWRVCGGGAARTSAGGDSWGFAVETGAEAATMGPPHIPATASVRLGGPPKVRPIESAQKPLAAMATMVDVVRPQRSETRPPSQQPAAPLAITTNAATLALRLAYVPPPRAARLSARNRAIHAHIA